MNEKPCTSEQAAAALAYLRESFPGWSNMSDTEGRSHLRLFAACKPSELREAIDELVFAASTRRPSPNEVAQRVKLVRRAKRQQTEAEHRRDPADDSGLVPAHESPALAAARAVLPARGRREARAA